MIALCEPSIESERINVASPSKPATLVYAHGAWTTFIQTAFISSPNEENLLETGEIRRLEDGYDLIRPIPYRIERMDEGEFRASFDEANIAISGVGRQDAYQSLVAEILDTFDTLTGEEQLSPATAAQLDVLRTYIARA